MMDFLLPLLKNSKSGVDDRGHRFGSGSPLTNYPHAKAEGGGERGGSEARMTELTAANQKPLSFDAQTLQFLVFIFKDMF